MPLFQSLTFMRLFSLLFALTVLPLSSKIVEAYPGSKTCSIPSDWFTVGIPDPQQTAVSTDFNSFCAFHTWAWNAFLWSMEEKDGVVRFETFPTQEQTINESYDPSTFSGILTLQPRAAKADHPIDSVAQAGTQGILVAQENMRGVYYSQHITPQMYHQIVNLDWNNAKGLTATPSTALFKVGNIEYKAAWAVVDDKMSVEGAYTRRALIPLLVTEEVNGVPTIKVPENPTYVEAKVALIGLHIVGWINQHSEAIWASFSPTGIAPIVPTNASGAAKIKPTDPVSQDGTPFYAAGTRLADCNQTNVPIQTLNASTQEFSTPTQVCQFYAAGTIGGFETDNGKAIKELNHSALSTIPPGNISKGYSEVGAVWSDADQHGVSKVNKTFQDALIGSNVLSNPVIETFTQTQVGQHNCFSCHNSLQFQPSDPRIKPLHASMLNLSHFLMQIYVDTYHQ